MKYLSIRNFGPIGQADIEFGDLTVLVGPQATGKSQFLMWLKLILDTRRVIDTLKLNAFDWKQNTDDFLELYFGEGMHAAWNQQTSVIERAGKSLTLEQLLRSKNSPESLFYVPAQRVVVLENGWPKPFTAFRSTDPFVVRDFSEAMRQLMESKRGADVVSPRYFRHEFKTEISHHIFRGMTPQIDTKNSQKRIVLAGAGETSQRIPFMAWSAGQREFMPLMLGLYWLMPASASPRRGDLKWAVIEEPEMGLHPKAIGTVLAMICELLFRGYKVCLSTHSLPLLEFIWGIKKIQEGVPFSKKPSEVHNLLIQLLGLETSQKLRKMAAGVLEKDFKVYYFAPQQNQSVTKDISSLDLWSDVEAIAHWGGLTEFGQRAGDVVSDVVRLAGSKR
ncbi:MAG: AAA family ATPase [Thermoguttaceae bacterium]